MATPRPSGIATAELSDDVRPQDDLFRHVNARWMAETEIPPDRAAHGAFHPRHDKAEIDVRGRAEPETLPGGGAEGASPALPAQAEIGVRPLAEAAASSASAEPGSDERK